MTPTRTPPDSVSRHLSEKTLAPAAHQVQQHRRPSSPQPTPPHPHPEKPAPASLPAPTLPYTHAPHAMRRRQRPFVALAAALLLVYCMWQWRPLGAMERLVQLQDPAAAPAQHFAEPVDVDALTGGKQAPSGVHAVEKRVPLEIHIMSKCPDAEMCLSELVVPAMVKAGDKVDFKLSFIGEPTEDDGGVLCKHGPTECVGNIIELCAFELYQDPKISLGFTMCITRDYSHIPERSLVEDCALEYGMDFQALNECTNREDGAHGISMLRRSVDETRAAGVTKSCTVRVDNKIYCIADGGVWGNCPNGFSVDALVETIDALAKA
ncbi:hypothetical protein BROUX41_000409 [Berkeleyomyces rouxiae]|uniref:uncharacterized protein n=1 Tax=Berkeleyomyces rouxiae TaxID=2035830 RepID=UPI003B7CFF1F